MATVFFNLVTRPYSTINDVKVALYKTTDPLAEVTSQTLPGPLLQTTWSFPGLERVNYICRIYEMDGVTVVALLDEFTFVPDNETVEFKSGVMIQAGVSALPGGEGVFPSGVSTVIIPDFIGWEIIVDRVGADTKIRDVDYSWDPITGTMILLKEDEAGNVDQFADGEYWWFEFELRESTGGGVSESGGDLFRSILYVTNDTTLVAADIGKKILVKGAVPYLEITLPEISACVSNRVTFFEFCRGTLKCCRIKTFSGDVIDWLEGSLSSVYGCPNETIELYKENVIDETPLWRVNDSDGNFRSVGQKINEDMNAAGVFNKLALDGSAVSSEDYARLYNRYVLVLPGAQVCAYADHETGNNIYKFSLKDSGTGLFYVPNRQGKFTRNTDGIRLPGDFEDQGIPAHIHYTMVDQDATPGTLNATTNKRALRAAGLGGNSSYRMQGSNTAALEVGETSNPFIDGVEQTGAADVRPDNVAENAYILV